MATPARLTEIECPTCRGTKWIIDNDYRGADLAGGIEHGYPERIYVCGGCGRNGAGWSVRQQAPAEFLLQPHDLYPMTRADFDHWVMVLRAHFPKHPCLAELGTRFFPRTPEEVEEARAVWEREHPVGKLRDQDGGGRDDPDLHAAEERVQIMRPGDTLALLRRDGGSLQIRMAASESFSLRCVRMPDEVLLDAAEVDRRAVLGVLQRYLQGDAPRTLEEVAAARAAWVHHHPVEKLHAPDGSVRDDPDMLAATLQVNSMRPGEVLTFLRRDSGSLQIRMAANESFSLRCVRVPDEVLLDAAEVDRRAVFGVLQRYLEGGAVAAHR